jgi:hypothetical protein
MKTLTWVIVFTLACSPVFADKLTPQQIALIKKFRSINASLHPQTGDVYVSPADVTLHLGTRYYFLPPEDARNVLVNAWGNPSDAVSDTLGLVFPAGALLATSFAPSGDVFAAEITSAVAPNNVGVISILGELDAGDGDKFRTASKAFDRAVVFLKGPGGDLASGLSIGEQIRAKSFITAVAFDNFCASACALAWLGGSQRNLSPRGRVGFHAAYTMTNGTAAEKGSANALVGAYLGRLGISSETIFTLTNASPEQIRWVHLAATAA